MTITSQPGRPTCNNIVSRTGLIVLEKRASGHDSMDLAQSVISSNVQQVLTIEVTWINSAFTRSMSKDGIYLAWR